MAYAYIFRKYKLEKKVNTWQEAKTQWGLQLEKGSAEDYLLGEFPVREKPKSWLDAAWKQILGK